MITDVISRVLLVTSNIRGSSICFPKSLYKKTSNEIFVELKAIVKTGASKVQESLTRPTSVCYDRSAVTACIKQPALTHTPTPPRGREEKDATKTNFSSCSDHSWIKNDRYIFFPYFRVWVFLFFFFFCELLSLQHNTLVLWYTQTFHQITKETNDQHGIKKWPSKIHCHSHVYLYFAWNTETTCTYSRTWPF